MPGNTVTWWTDNRVEETVNHAYICSHLRPDEQELLNQSPSFAAGLTDDTYLDWILNRAKRFFLILVDVGVPDQIFGIVDDSFDDNDLPISEAAIPALRLSYEPMPTLDRRFYKAQFRYLIRVLEDGEHIRYAEEEIVPVYPSTTIKNSVIPLAKDGTDKVRLPSKTSSLSKLYLRKRVALDEHSYGLSESAMLTEIASVRKYAHQHLMSVFGTYTHHESIYVLFTPAPEYTLKAVLENMPKAFDNLSKAERRQTMINWIHCLASGLAWLHGAGRPHGLIRPSNVHLDDRFCIFLGQFDDASPLATALKGDDIEAYQYAAPERWKRAITTQVKGAGKFALTSGGRTARKISIKPQEDGSSGTTNRTSWSSDLPRLETEQPTSTEYSFIPIARGNFSRLYLSRPGSNPAGSDVSSTNSSQPRTENRTRPVTSPRSPPKRDRAREVPSALSNASTGSNRTVKAPLHSSVFVNAPEIRTARVQTWQSAQYDLFSADMFSTGAIILDILTVLCKKSLGSFSRHRSSKNRQAGRGGGLADASFHANIGQVMEWASSLQEEGARRAKKEDGQVYGAVGPLVNLVKRCMERDPVERIGSRELEKRSQEYIISFAKIDKLHCETKPENLSSGSGGSRRSRATPLPVVQPQERQRPTDSSYQDDEIREAPLRQDEWAKLRSQGLQTATIPSAGPESSISSLSSFNFDHDVASETVVGGSHQDDMSTRSHKQDIDFDLIELQSQLQIQNRNAKLLQHWHENESSVDPRLMTRQNMQGFAYKNYSKSVSSESVESREKESFLLPESRPTSIVPPQGAPQGPLPAIPSKDRQKKDRSSRYKPQRMSTDPMDSEWPNPPQVSVLPSRASSLQQSVVAKHRSRNTSQPEALPLVSLVGRQYRGNRQD